MDHWKEKLPCEARSVPSQRSAIFLDAPAGRGKIPHVAAMKLVLIAIATGLVAGLLGALCGVGGGVVMVPAFVGLLGLDHKQAVATSMAVIVVTAVAATANNARASNLIDWRIVAATGLASAAAAWFGSDLMRSLGNQTLTRIFGCLLVGFGIRMLWKG